MSVEALLTQKLSKEDIERLKAELEEITADDVVKRDITKTLMWKRSSLLSVGEKILPIQSQATLEEKVYQPDIEQISGDFPVPETVTAPLAAPVPYIESGITMDMAEYRFVITYFAKARGMDNWQYDAQVRAGSEWFARCIDQQILDAIYAGAGATGVTVGAGDEWDSDSATMDPEKDILNAWNNILAESNVSLEDMNNVFLVYPAKVDGVLRQLRMIGNQSISLMTYFKQAYGFNFLPTRYYDETGSTKLQDDAFMCVKSEETGVHRKYTGGAIPLARTKEVDRGSEYLVRQIFGTKIFPSAKGGTTSKRICKIANVI